MGILGIYASQISGHLSAPFDSLQTVTVGAGGASSVSFTSIPSIYKHLQIRCLVRESDTNVGAGALWLRANADTGSNYSWHRFWGNGSTVSNGNASSTTWSLVGINSRAGNGTNVFGSTIIDVLDYSSNSKYKTFRGLTGEDPNGTDGYIGVHSGLWMNTDAITSLTLYPSSTYSWTQYSSFALYGIKGE